MDKPLTKSADGRLPSVLIVDDTPEIREQMQWGLKPLYRVFEAGDRESAMDIVRREEDIFLVTLDLGLPPDAEGVTEGLEVLNQILAANRLRKVIVITGNQDRDNALKAIQLGAYDYMEKPIDMEVLKVVLQRGAYLTQLERENQALLERERHRGFQEMIGSSPSMAKVFETIRRVATTNVSILIVGESGTGKELVARAIHKQSPRNNGPFIVINCGAIPETLLESELFGHEKGAFTGAHIQRRGRVELAQGGTLFLDEISELSPLLQVKLLRVLQEHCIERVGGRVEIPVDVRIIAACNVDLQEAMKEGRFREDLYYRLNTIMISVPPLRERGSDVLIIAKVFLRNFAEEANRKISGFSQEACASLGQYQWPGNVRELENRIKRAVTLSDHVQLTPEDLDLGPPDELPVATTLKEAREQVETHLIQQTLFKTNHNITKAAIMLGVSRPTLHDLLSRYHIKK